MEEATLKAVARELSLEKDFDLGTTGLIMVMVMMVMVMVMMVKVLTVVMMMF